MYLHEEVDEGEFLFVTESGSSYNVYFTDGSNYLPDEPFSPLIYMFGFERVQRVKTKIGSDPRILQTIVHILSLVFEKNPDSIIVYVCSQTGGLQRKRSLLFEDLFHQFGTGFKKINYSDSESFYCSAIFREENTYSFEIEESIRSFVRNKQNPV
ncbi:hypothetical protein GCM10028803_47300 [Larkinella knui]|uniref:Uncharacterized protein n=1 Tax=Larkinella knui TaxID=2025310 RepID=A0A3P1CPR5_9BACT|nr:hypothetical protein [Larkinella knui]RRB15313.1 hypothetical protein EHT87_12310 [Larkinella knui]